MEEKVGKIQVKGQGKEIWTKEDQGQIPQIEQIIEDLGLIHQIDLTKEIIENPETREGTEMNQEVKQQIKETKEIKIQGIMVIILMIVQEETPEEEKEEETMKKETTTTTGTHEISARRFHTWGYLL